MPIKISEEGPLVHFELWTWTRKSHTVLSSLDFCRRPPDSVMDLRLTFVKQARLIEKVTLTSDKVDADQTSEKVSVEVTLTEFREGQLWRPPHGFLDFWKTILHGFRLTFEEGQAWLFVKLTSYSPEKSKSRYQRRSKHLEKVTRWCCFRFRWYEVPILLWRRSRVIVSEGQCRSSENINARITLVHFELWSQCWEKDTVARPADSVMDFRRTLEKVKRDCLRRLHLTSDKVMPIRTSVKVSVEGNSWRVEYSPLPHTMLSNWTSGRPPDSVMDFRLTFEEGQARLFCEAYILHLTKSMPINTSEKVKTSRKSHTVLSCLTSAESFITPDFVGTIPLDSVRFRRLHPTDSTTIFDQADDYQENASLSVSEQVPHEKSRSNSRK